MILQKLLFLPDERLDRNLFYRMKKPDADCIGKNEIPLAKGNVLKANTYFNAFSMEKWMKYTAVKDVFLIVEIKGNCRISIYGMYQEHSGWHIRKIVSKVCKSKTGMEKIQIDVPAKERFQSIFFEIEAIGNAVFYGGFYGTAARMQNDVKLAVDICTYHRVPYIERTVRQLEQNIFQNKNSMLYEKLQVFVVDNSNAEAMKKYETKNIHVFCQKEKGSSGGFTRGLLEIQKSREYTHCILMDDDVFLYTEALERLYSFLCFAKQEYGDMTIGGGLLRADLPYIQHEAGAVWNAGMIRGCKRGYDLRNYQLVVRNETEEPVSYMGWWMCCIPMKIIEKRGYPLPLYFHRDDIEFGLRNTMQMTLNGVCIWHEPFEAKTGVINEYYDMRNTGIVNALYQIPDGKQTYRKYLVKKVIVNLFRYKYRAVELMIKGARDFMREPEQITDMDCGEFYSELKKYEYPEHHADKPGIRKIRTHVPQIPGWMKYITFNGAVLACRGEKAVPAFEPDTNYFWRLKKAYFYNPYTNTFFKTIRSNRKAVKYMMQMAGLLFQIEVSYKKVSDRWRKKFCELVSEEHWQKLLED